ncbi:MAG TPA: hypothetical protein VLB76_03580 [Thermoanaerobaculia bacterium]|nr:hypothetical protein [Thermoanaerobaculia bacterium]
MYPRGYSLSDGANDMLCAQDADSGEGRCSARFVKRAGQEPARSLKIVIVPSMDGGYELHLFGRIADKAGGDKPNPEVADLKKDFETLVGELKSAPLGTASDGILSYQLSNMQADRAVAVLKTFGYPVIEYTKSGSQAGSESGSAKNLEKPPEIFDQKPSVLSSASPFSGGLLSRPVVIKLIDSEDTSLVQATDPEITGFDTEISGGQRLSSVTDSAPQQRLLIVYDKGDIASLDVLLARLQKYIDVPARQILIEALVVELEDNRLLDLGVDFTGSKNGYNFSFDEADGMAQPFIFNFARPHPITLLNLTAKIRALVERGKAKVLSRPSVFVLDGRQAKIKVGDNIPYTSGRSITVGGVVNVVTSFLKTGIILNLRPRAASDNSEVTMQVETIISSPGPTTRALSDGILVAPTVQSRLVQTLVRVANDTPFVIGGLVAQTDQKNTNGIPGLSSIPLIGALFRKENSVKDRREVIIVITPHIVRESDPTLAYSIARDAQGASASSASKEKGALTGITAESCEAGPENSIFAPRKQSTPAERESIFDSFDAQLFRNTYRVRSGDIFDLDFIRENPRVKEDLREVQDIAKKLTSAQFNELPRIDPKDLEKEVSRRLRRVICGDEEGIGCALTSEQIHTFLTLFDGDIPGEEVFVNNMLIRVIEKLGFSGFVPPDHVIFFSQDPDESLIHPKYLTDNGFVRNCLKANKTIVMAFPPDLTRPLQEPVEKSFYEKYQDLYKEFRRSCSVAKDVEMPLAPAAFTSFSPPNVRLVCMPLSDAEYIKKLRECNERDSGWHAILLNRTFCGGRSRNPIALLQSVLTLKRLLEINDSATFPRTLRAFHVGRELVLPTREDLETRRHLIDRRTAQLFYETLDYYYAFGEAYRQMNGALREPRNELSIRYLGRPSILKQRDEKPQGEAPKEDVPRGRGPVPQTSSPSPPSELTPH